MPAGYEFLDGNATRALLKAGGEATNGQELWLSTPTNSDWSVIFEFSEIGFVKDDDKSKLDPDKILESFKKGTAEQNKERVRNGNSPLKSPGRCRPVTIPQPTTWSGPSARPVMASPY